jgi:hypothetical protein
MFRVPAVHSYLKDHPDAGRWRRHARRGTAPHHLRRSHRLRHRPLTWATTSSTRRKQVKWWGGTCEGQEI